MCRWQVWLILGASAASVTLPGCSDTPGDAAEAGSDAAGSDDQSSPRFEAGSSTSGAGGSPTQQAEGGAEASVSEDARGAIADASETSNSGSMRDGSDANETSASDARDVTIDSSPAADADSSVTDADASIVEASLDQQAIDGSIDGPSADEADADTDSSVTDADASIVEASLDQQAIDGSTDGPSVDEADVVEAAAPVSCPSGITPGTPPTESCGPDLPVITQSGSYPFSFTGATSNYTLSCGYGYPGKRDLIYGVCFSRTREVTTTLVPDSDHGQVYVASPSGTCGATCGQVPGLPGRFRPGAYAIMMEGYEDGPVTLNVSIGPPTTLAVVGSCSEADSWVSDDGPVAVPSRLGVSGSGGPPAVAGPSCYKGSSTGVGGFDLRSAAQVTITQPPLNSINWGLEGGGYSLRSQCDAAATDLDCRSDQSTMFTRLLGPGTYYVATGGRASPVIDLDPPWPPATNTSCASGRAFVQGDPAILEDRVVTAGDRYYTVTATRTGLTVHIAPASTWASATLAIRSDCVNGPDLGSSDIMTTPSGTGIQLMGLPPGTYSIVVSNIVLGTRYSIWAT
jgi:hypothetical protein